MNINKTLNKALFAVSAASVVLMLGGCAGSQMYAAMTGRPPVGGADFNVHNKGWSEIKDPAQGVMKLATTRDLYLRSNSATVDGTIDSVGAAKVSGGVLGLNGKGSYIYAGYTMRTCAYSAFIKPGAENKGAQFVGDGVLTPAQTGVLTENRMEPCMHLQGFYNDLASGVGGYCTTDGQPTQKFINAASEFLKEHGSLSVFEPVVEDYSALGVPTKKYSIPWPDSTPEGFAKVACADAVTSARAGGFWHVGCQAYKGAFGLISSDIPMRRDRNGALVAAGKEANREVWNASNGNPDYSCYFTNKWLYEGYDNMTYGPIALRQLQTWVSLNPLYDLLLGEESSISANDPQAQVARQYLTRVWQEVKAAHPYTGPTTPLHIKDFTVGKVSGDQAQQICQNIIRGQQAYGGGTYNFVGGLSKCMIDHGWVNGTFDPAP
jgi:hypothetical protein